MWFWEHTIIAQILSIMYQSLTQSVCEIFDHAHFHDVIVAMNETKQPMEQPGMIIKPLERPLKKRSVIVHTPVQFNLDYLNIDYPNSRCKENAWSRYTS